MMQNHRESKQRAREVEELSRCTFQPELISTQSHGRHRTVHMADAPPGSPSWHTQSEMNYMEPETAAGVFCSPWCCPVSQTSGCFSLLRVDLLTDLLGVQGHCVRSH